MKISWVGLLLASVQASFGFALLGPVNEAYQVNTIGYNLAGDVGAPKNLGEEYRRNTPVMYYTCDANFLDYFGGEGVKAIDAAFAVFNEVFSPTNGVEGYSSDLSEFPYQAMLVNHQAEALYLEDIKSWTMWMIIEQLGLAEPERYTWGLHNRYTLTGGTCPYDQVYSIIKRNFDPLYGTSVDQLKPTSYVNGTLYSYQIPEYCAAPVPPQAWAEPFRVDQTAEYFTSVAGGGGAIGMVNSYALSYGTFFTGLTRDDVGGLRYLLRANNMNYENAGNDTTTYVQGTTPALLVTSNLTLFAYQAITNDAAALQTLYPGLVVNANSSNYFVNVYTTNTTGYLTNYPWDPVGTAQHLEYVTNITATVQTWYQHSFANVLLMTNKSDGSWAVVPMPTVPSLYGNATVTLETTSAGITNKPWAPINSTVIVTNTTLVSYTTNIITGDMVILPTNLCSVQILYSQLTNVISITNVLVAPTNFTSTTTTTNASTNYSANTLLYYAQNEITYFTNHAFVYLPIYCQTSNIALYQGIQKMRFVRRDYDSLLSRLFNSVTNEYRLNAVTNGAIISQKVLRSVTSPDFLITAADLSSGPAQVPPPSPAIRIQRAIHFNTNNVPAGQGNPYANLAGPGTIDSFQNYGLPNAFVFNKVGPIYEREGLVNTNAFLTEATQIPLLMWGSYDASTNTPVVYPNDVSISEIENQVLIQITPTYLPEGAVAVTYAGQLDSKAYTANWQPPCFWSLAPGSAALPPGLYISTVSSTGALIYGTPTTEGFYDFTLRVTDSQGRSLDRSYFIKVNPQY